MRATSAHGADAEGVHVIGLGAHLVIVAEGFEFGLGHAQGLQQQRIGVDMHRLHIGEGGHHHLHFQRLEDRDVALEVIVAHFDVALGEEAENLGQQSLFGIGEAARLPILDVGAQRHFLAHPMGLLLALPAIIGPGIAGDVIGAAGIEQADLAGPDQERGSAPKSIVMSLNPLRERLFLMVAPAPRTLLHH